MPEGVDALADVKDGGEATEAAEPSEVVGSPLPETPELSSGILSVTKELLELGRVGMDGAARGCENCLSPPGEIFNVIKVDEAVSVV
jgi:hypothetical protein